MSTHPGLPEEKQLINQFVSIKLKQFDVMVNDKCSRLHCDESVSRGRMTGTKGRRTGTIGTKERRNEGTRNPMDSSK